jgi:hypothetical protein
MALLQNTSITFYTNNDDKDSDTNVTVMLMDADGIVAALSIMTSVTSMTTAPLDPMGLTIMNPSHKSSLQS